MKKSGGFGVKTVGSFLTNPFEKQTELPETQQPNAYFDLINQIKQHEENPTSHICRCQYCGVKADPSEKSCSRCGAPL